MTKRNNLCLVSIYGYLRVKNQFTGTLIDLVVLRYSFGGEIQI